MNRQVNAGPGPNRSTGYGWKPNSINAHGDPLSSLISAPLQYIIFKFKAALPRHALLLPRGRPGGRSSPAAGRSPPSCRGHQVRVI